MFIQYLLILTFIQMILSCPIPYNLQAKCRCAITEIGRVYIYCARKQLTEIPHFDTSNIIFDELVLSGNRISNVEKNAFTGLKLRKLELQSNPIRKIESNAFIDLANYLEELTLSSTLQTSELNFSTFLQILSELPNLKRLTLRSFDLSTFSNTTKAFVLRKLTHLSLQSCSISQIDDIELFANLFPNLERLDLSENRLDSLPLILINSLKKLKILNLSKNKIRHLNLHSSVLNLQLSNSLIELDLSYNGIETIDENIFEIISSQLEILNLRNNELSNEKQLEFLVHLSNLREFYLDYNRLEALNQLNFPLNLKILSLKNNRLNQINFSLFTRLDPLEKLFLSSNKITKLNIRMKNIFQSLEILEFDRNQLTFIQTLNAPKLKHLNFDGNFLGKKLEKKFFANLISLERLHLRDNDIEEIDVDTFQNTRLQFLGKKTVENHFIIIFFFRENLDLRNNSLKIFPLFTKLNETLQIVSLRRNQLCTIESVALNYYIHLQTLELEQNPLHCDCRMERKFREIKITGQCESPPERRNVLLSQLPNESFACSIMTTSQCSYITKTIVEKQTEPTTITTTTTTTTTTTVKNIVEKLVDESPGVLYKFPEPIRVTELSVSLNSQKNQIFLQWQIHPSTIDEYFDDNYRRKVLEHHGITGFKISTNSPLFKMSELIDILKRNYTLNYYQQTEICLYLLRKSDYEKYCKQLPLTATHTSKSSLILDANQTPSQTQSWYMNEPAKSILMGSIFGILFVLILLIFIIIIISRCPHLLLCHLNPSKYHGNDSKSESLLVRPTPTNTIPWPTQSQQYFYPHQHTLRPASYQASLSTQCTCPTHYHSSGSSASTGASSSSTNGQNYHIYQEILNEDLNPLNHYRTCRSTTTKANSNSPPTSSTNTTMNSEQCQHCSLSVLV